MCVCVCVCVCVTELLYCMTGINTRQIKHTSIKINKEKEKILCVATKTQISQINKYLTTTKKKRVGWTYSIHKLPPESPYDPYLLLHKENSVSFGAPTKSKRK